MEPSDIKLIDFSKETKKLFKSLPKCKQYQGNLKQQVAQFIMERVKNGESNNRRC